MVAVTLARALAALWPPAATLLIIIGLGAACELGCSSAPAGPLVVSWQFVDGRDCFSTSAAFVEARSSPSSSATPLTTFRCVDGLAPLTVTVDHAPGSGTLYFDARSPLAADLYRGELAVDAAPPASGEPRVVTLYAVAAQ